MAEPTGAFVAEVNRILGKEKYLLRKGDARGIAKAYLDSGAPPEPLDCKLLLKVAEEWMKDRPTLPRSKSEPAVIEPEPIPDDAVKEAADIVLRKLSETDDIVEDIVRDLVDVVVDEGRFRVVVDETPWDVSTGAKYTGEPYDLSAYETVADFLKEPTGNTVATYISGHGLAAETYGDHVMWVVGQVAWDVLYETLEDELWPSWQGKAGWSDDPKVKSATLRQWRELAYAFMEDEREFEEILFESDLMDRVENVSWEEAVARFRPDALPRLQADRERRKRVESRLETLRPAVRRALNEKTDQDAEPADWVVAKTLATAADAEGLAALSMWLNDDASVRQLPWPRRVREEWLDRLDACLEDIGPGETAWDRPTVSLWRYLTDAWFRDGRPWYVTVLEWLNDTQHITHTFSTDNWERFFVWSLSHVDGVISIVIRRFEHLRDASTGLPLKTMCGLVIDEKEKRCVALSADEMREAHTTDAETGRRLGPEPGVRYAKAREVLKGWEAFG
ncbi:hypothetical protein [Kyrpidia tusciae]|uniref:Uncharacterized protein n=1 Tax=Kyrpidia tusciae (strain DSM 2912 / NBRC 15312 / T2) TaxID=562970 RepID=D5WVL8_KYRT2|nr:hypothetical protein [Kyrpidia tusciae]ADG07561.1 hypothetical protein Btus_2926 [Kyrpidia tusciae DSM 2912]